MTYDTQSRVGGGAIADAYLFYQDQRPTPVVWPFTNAERGFRLVTADFPGGVDFSPDAGFARGPIEGTNETQAAEIKITVANDNPVALQWKQQQPEYPIWLKIFRVQLLTTRAVRSYIGQVVNGDFHDDVCELTVTSLKGLFQKRLPLKTYQPTCNNQLYDQFCTMSMDNFRATGTIVTISDREITLNWTAHTIATWPVTSGYFNAGIISRADVVDRGGREMITDHLETTGGADAALTMLQRVSWLTAGDSIYVYAGCDRKFETCFSKFNNIPHFLGFPFIPNINPYTSGVD